MIKETYCNTCNKYLGIDGDSFKFCPSCGSEFDKFNGFDVLIPFLVDDKNGIAKYYRTRKGGKK